MPDLRAHRRVSLAAATILLSFTLAAGCTGGGTDTDNPVLEFQTSGCKSKQDLTALTASGVALTTARLDRVAMGLTLERDVSDYDGFHCYAWALDAQAGSLAVDVLNMNGGCEVEWAGSAERGADGGMDLVISNTRCAVAGCGWCIYDFSFELADVDAGAPLSLSLVEDDCHTREVFSELELPLDTEPSGIRCRPAFKHALNGGLGPACDGQLHMPCGGPTCADSGASECQGDLLCTELGADDARCMAPCETDADCDLEVLSCQEGVCGLREGF